MDYFENILKKVFEEQGKWVKQSFKVEITKDEKRAIGKPSLPRPEIDLIAYSPGTNILEVWEVKSFLDSRGVIYEDIRKKFDVPEGVYKLFTSHNYRRIVLERLVIQLTELKMVLPNPQVQFGLAAGNFRGKDEEKIRIFISEMGWNLMGPKEIAGAIMSFENLGYENDPYVIASKIIFRNLDVK